jgi:hypothetical protein
MIDNNQLLMASPRPLVPDVEEDLRLLFDMPVRSVLCTAAKVNQAVTKHYPRDAAYVPPAAAAKEQKAARKPKAAKAPRQQADRTHDEQFKRSGMIGLIVFNVAVVLYMLYRMLFGSGMAFGQYLGQAAIAVGIGLVVGLIAFGMALKLKL